MTPFAFRPPAIQRSIRVGLRMISIWAKLEIGSPLSSLGTENASVTVAGLCSMFLIREKCLLVLPAPGKLSTTVTFFHTMLLLAVVLALTLEPSLNAIPRVGEDGEVSRRASKQKCPCSCATPQVAKSAGFGGNQ